MKKNNVEAPEIMKQVRYPEREIWNALLKRPELEQSNLGNTVKQVFDFVRKNGDKALKKYTNEFDKVELEEIRVSVEEMNLAGSALSDELKEAIRLAKTNIETFHRSQISESGKPVETSAGVVCWRESRPIDSAGIYIPGGSAPLFSTVLMLGIPAKIAGCKEIVLCTPPGKEGKVNPAILYAAQLVGIEKIFKVGGIQAVAAMTFGTESVPMVNKIFGPGNQYVTAAKQLAMLYGVAIDLPAGPSELLIIADDQSSPEFIAADLLSQAEHGIDSQVILLTDYEMVIERTLEQLELQLQNLPRKEIAKLALANSRAILLESQEMCFDFSNQYAPEHLILAIDQAEKQVGRVQNAGSVFLGNYSCESAGDYASGTNHTLPTNGYARNYSGVSVDSFVKTITFQQISEEGIRTIGPAIELMAEAEHLLGHKNAVSVRLK